MLTVLQDPAGKGGTATAVHWYRAWMDANRPAERVEHYLDDSTAATLRQVATWDVQAAVPRLWPRLHLPQYATGAFLLRDEVRGREIHVVGASAVHGALAGRHPVQVVWIATTITDERRPEIWRGRSPARRALYRATRRPLARLDRAVVHRAERILAMSVHTADRLVAEGADHRRVEVVPVPVDTATFAPPPSGADRHGALFVGRANDWRKGFDRVSRLLQRSAAVRTRGVTAISSAPPVPQAGLRTLGRVEDLAPAYRGAELLLLPSRQEGLGIVVLEALACATPVVAFRAGGPDQILIESGGGTLVDDEAAFVVEVERLLAEPSRRADMGAAGRAWVEANASSRAFLADGSIFTAP